MSRPALLALAQLLWSAVATAEELNSAVDQDYPVLQALYRSLHSNPELSGQEFDTAKRLAAEARNAGFTVTEQVGGTGVVAVLHNGDGPTLMLRTELDALPIEENTGLPYASQVRVKNAKGEETPVSHACGHDIHMTVWTGAARRLAAERADWSGTLVMIAQPAEETIGGAKAMLSDGLFTRFPRPDYILALHDTVALPAGSVSTVQGYVKSAADSVDIDIKGIGGHGAMPQNTRDPVVLAAMIVVSLQTLVSRTVNPLDPAVVTVGSIHGGSKHNIIGTAVKLQLTVRSTKDETRRLLLDGIRRIALNQARAFGMPEDQLPEVTLVESVPATYNNPALVARLVPVLQAALGSDRVRPGEPVMASEDFAEYGLVEPRIPSAQLWLGAVNPALFAATPDKSRLPGTHSSGWAPDAEPTIKTGVITLASAALDLLAKPKAD